MKGLALVVVLLAASSAVGQTTQQVSKAFESNRAQVNVIQMAMENLQGMAIGTDAVAVGGITNTVMLFLAPMGTVVAVGDLLPKMRDAEDANHVRVQFQNSLDPVLKMQDANINYMNGAMTLLKSPAALAEATKLRDAMVAIRAQLRTLRT